MESLISDSYVPDIRADTRTEIDRKLETFGLNYMFGLNAGVWLLFNVSSHPQTLNIDNNMMLRLELLYHSNNVYYWQRSFFFF